MAGQLLFIGDSLIQFFNWQARFPNREILNCGIAGETAEGLFARLPSLMKRAQSPSFVMIMTGINNVAMEDYGFLFTYEKIIAGLKEQYGQKSFIAMTSLLPVNLPYIADAVPRVNSILRETAEKFQVFYLDLYPYYVDEKDRQVTEYFEFDGVHLSAAGYEVWAKALETNIFPGLP